MKKYSIVDISEKQLEELVRRGAHLIEDGLQYVDHQKRTDRGPLDVLFVDSGNALVVAELKVTEDDSMLVQGIDYYDYITANVEGYARAYKSKKVTISPTQETRLLLAAPTFSVTLLNRCKWIDIPISLFTFQCIVLEDSPEEIIPVWKEIPVPPRIEPVTVYTMEERLGYITDPEVRSTVEALLEEVQDWDKERVLMDPTSYDISLKVSGRVFAYIGPRRRHFTINTNDTEGKWTIYPIHQADDLEEAKALMRTNFEKYGRAG